MTSRSTRLVSLGVTSLLALGTVASAAAQEGTSIEMI